MNIFITGNPGCGKSTLIQKVLDKISDKKVSGIITPEIRSDRERQGFKIIDLASGKEEILASTNIERGPGVSKYRVNIEGIDIIMDKFLKSYKDSEYVVIDEIGMMEFYSEKFKKIMDMVLNSNKMVIATLSKRFVQRYKNEGKVYYLSRDNFDEVYARVLSQIK
ncbi:MAG: NTPase [Candidatus Aminicenantales bacterium]